MGFFQAKATCAICGREVGLNRWKLQDGQWACPQCFKAAGHGLTNAGDHIMSVDELEADTVKTNEMKDLAEAITPTKVIGDLIVFDEKHELWGVKKGTIKKSVKKAYPFSAIKGYELLEDGTSITKGGLGSAVVGGVLLGPAGAIVGGIVGKRKNKEYCTSLQIKITLDSISEPTVYIDFISGKIKKSGFVYKQMYKAAQECLSVLQVICSRN